MQLLLNPMVICCLIILWAILEWSHLKNQNQDVSLHDKALYFPVDMLLYFLLYKCSVELFFKAKIVFVVQKSKTPIIQRLQFGNLILKYWFVWRSCWNVSLFDILGLVKTWGHRDKWGQNDTYMNMFTSFLLWLASFRIGQGYCPEVKLFFKNKLNTFLSAILFALT